MKPLVSIAIPTLNRCGYLRLALDSALKQTYPEVEIIVSDNASTDETANFLGQLKDRRVVTLRQPVTVPVFEHWDKCLNAARGEYFLVLSDDDLLHPDAIQKMVDLFQAAPLHGVTLAFAGCRTTVIDGAGAIKYRGAPVPINCSAEDTILAFFRSTIELVPCAMLFRRSSILDGYSRFARQFYLGADAALWIGLVAAEGHAGFVNEELAMYRVHTNTTIKTPLSNWYFENRELAEYSIARLKEHGRGDNKLYRKIRTAARQLNTRITASFIAAQWKRSKVDSLRTAKQHGGQLANAYGIVTTIKFAIVALLPDALRPALIALRRRLRERLLTR
jgi:glycosyltransferase involved in cell wall biosynthesis